MKQLLTIILIGGLLSGCLAKQQSILPTSTEREALTNNYMRCVADATNARYDRVTSPEVIVRGAMDRCIRAKNAMIREYPKSWRTNMVKTVEEKLYQREIAWIEQNRSEGRSGR